MESFISKSGFDRLSTYDLMPGMRVSAQAQFIQFIGSIFWASLWLLAFLVPAMIGGLIGAQLFRKPLVNNAPPLSQSPQP